MENTHHDLVVEAGALRVNVRGEEYMVSADQAPARELERHLRKRMRPENSGLRKQAAAEAELCVSAIDALMCEQQVCLGVLLARQRRTRRRMNTAPGLMDMFISNEASLMFSSKAWAEEAMPGIVRAGMGAVCSSLRSERPIGIVSIGDVFEGALCFEIGAGSSSCSVLGVAVSRGSSVYAPYSSGVINNLMEAMDCHARRHPDVRHAWAIMLGPGCVRVCFIEPNAIHLSAVKSTESRAGRLLLGAAVANAAHSESWRLGADPTMQWNQDIERWVIECPGADDGEPAETFYAPREPEFIASSFFGRFTRCFAVALNHNDTEFGFILKDSWQLVSTNLEDADLSDEICVLRDMRDKLATVECNSAELQRMVTGGTVLIDNTRDSTQFMLGTKLGDNVRGTAIHGSRRSTPAYRLHRRMVSGPIGVPLHKITNDRDAAAAVAGAMSSHTTILRETGILHRDISLGNVLAVRHADGSVRGMLIDYDHSIAFNDKRNQGKPVCVGTKPYMSIANLEGIDVARTSVDDWEAALALLLCWAAYPRCRKELRAKLGSVGPNRSADLRRELFASRKSLEATISAYLDPACKHTLRLIRGLYEALFEHPSCSGAARATLCGNRWTDPIKYRTQLSVKIEERCFKVVTEYLSAYATEFMVEHLVEYLVKSDSEASQTLVAQPELQPSPISSVVGNRSAAMTQRPLSTPVAPAASPLPAHPLPSPNICGLGGALRNKRKVNEDAKLSPKVKRPRSSYTAHSSGSPGASSISISLASSGDSSGPSHKTISSALSSDSRGAPRIISSSSSSGDSPSALHKAIASATPSDSLPKKRKSSQEEPPAGPSPKRRK